MYTYAKELEKKHAVTYKSFFAQYDLVLSLPYTYRIGHALGRGSTPLALRGKLPQKVFLGINRVTDPGVRIEQLTMYNMHTESFETTLPYEQIKYISGIASVTTEMLAYLDTGYGLDIGILAEYPKGYGTSFDTLVITLIASALFVCEQKLPLELMKNYTFAHSIASTDIALLASYIKYLVMGDAATCLPFLALDERVTPLLQVGKIDFSIYKKPDLYASLLHLSQRISLENERQEKVLGVCGLIPSESQLIQPFWDIAFIHLGQSYESIREKEASLTDITAKQRGERFGKLMGQENIAVSIDELLLNPYDVYTHMSSLLYTRLVHAIVTGLSPEKNHIHEREFFSILKDMGFRNCLAERQYEMITLLYTVFDAVKTHQEEMCAFIPLTTVTTGGTFMAIIPRHGERKTIEQMISSLSEHHNCQATLLYATRKEQPDFGGLQINQYISEDIFSSYITKGTVQLLTGGGVHQIDQYESLLIHPHVQQGVTFDLVKKKILLNGEKITHKQICSQSATIEILMHLLEHLGEAVPNRHLPPSAYSKNKNEMVSKIILPLQEMFQTSFEETLELSCTGTMYEWTVSLKQKPTHLHLIHYLYP